MKPYQVRYTDQFDDALEAQVSYFMKQGAPKTRLETWLTNLYDLADSLEEFPHRYPVAEPESAIGAIELRKIVFGDYLMFYHVDDDHRTVQILGFRHGARLP